MLAVILGCFVTLKLLSWVMQWLWGVWTQVSAEPAQRSSLAVIAAALLVPGPWVLFIIAALTVKFVDTWWALWVAVGAGGGVIFFVWAIFEGRRRVREGHSDENTV